MTAFRLRSTLALFSGKPTLCPLYGLSLRHPLGATGSPALMVVPWLHPTPPFCSTDGSARIRRCVDRDQAQSPRPRCHRCQHDGQEAGGNRGAVHCLALGGVDLASSSGTMTMNVLNAVAQFERDLLIERPPIRPQTSKIRRQDPRSPIPPQRGAETGGAGWSRQTLKRVCHRQKIHSQPSDHCWPQYIIGTQNYGSGYWRRSTTPSSCHIHSKLYVAMGSAEFGCFAD